MFAFVVTAITCGVLGGVIANRKNRDIGKWAILCGLLALPFLPILLALPSLPSLEDQEYLRWKRHMSRYMEGQFVPTGFVSKGSADTKLS
jgi:hypothetical protein